MKYAKTARGMSTVELLIAFALVAITLSASTLVALGGQTEGLDVNLTNVGLYRERSQFEKNVAAALGGWTSLVNSSVTENGYVQTRTVTGISPCVKVVETDVSWVSDKSRSQYAGLTTLAASVEEAKKLGGDCFAIPPASTWENPQRFASDALSPGKTTAIDALHKIAYLGADKEPYLFIADARAAVLGQSNGMMIGDNKNPFGNLFNNDGKSLDQINDIDAGEVNGRTYVFAATASTTAQFVVIDVTDINNPNLVARRTLAGVTATDATAWGWRIFYYNNKVYISTRETAGPEFHVFSVSTPTNPTELGSVEINTTANDFVVQGNTVFFADESDARGELLTYNVTTPSAITEYTGARTNISGDQNGYSLFLSGAYLYLGRQSVSGGPELYLFDVSNPGAATTGYTTIGTPVEIGGDVVDINVAGSLAFLVSGKTNEEFQVWDIYNPSAVTLVKKYNFGNIVAGGVDYDPDYIYATGDATPNFQVLYGGPPFSYTLSNTGGMTVSQGSAGNTTVSSYLTSGTAKPIAYNASGLPTGATASFSNSPCTPNCSTTVTISTDATTPAGTYPVTVSGTPGGTTNPQTTFNLVVQAFDYTLSNSGNVTVNAGSAGNTTVTRTSVLGTGSVTLSASGLPSGATATFTNNPCTPTCNSTLTISTTVVTVPGTYTVTVTGSPNGSGNPSTTFTLTVNSPSFVYSLSASPATQTLAQGSSYLQTITVTKLMGTAQPVTVTLSGFQNNVSYTSVPASATCTPNSACAIIFTITAANNGQKVTRTITATGSAPATTTAFSLRVQ